MNDLQVPAKFLYWIVGTVLILGGVGCLGKATLYMANAAIEAQHNNQMSYGRFSRQLWGREDIHRK